MPDLTTTEGVLLFVLANGAGVGFHSIGVGLAALALGLLIVLGKPDASRG